MNIKPISINRSGGIVLIASMVIMFVGAAVAFFTLAQSQTGFGGEVPIYLCSTTRLFSN